jgi:gamma-glutamyltranspeptidase / glutathione hydrolase
MPPHTTNLCAVDADRNAVSITQTLGGLFGSTVTVPGTGILLNDMMLIFDPRPGHLNSIEGGKSQAAPYTPAVLLRDGRLRAVLGAPGGRRIPTAIAQVISNLVDHGMGIQDAIAAPRLHAESSVLEVDERFGAETVTALQQLGHPVVVEEKTVCSFNFANPVGIVVNEDGRLAGGTDPCLPGAAVGLSLSTP